MPETHPGGRDEIAELSRELASVGYLADRPLAMTLYLAQRLEIPVLLEGEPGVGKTSAAEAFAAATGARLLRLQCYEGLGSHQALYEWDYTRQLLSIRMHEGAAEQLSNAALRASIFSEEYLLRRPLLEAIWPVDCRPVVLLIDEIDRSDEEFEALLLELLSQFQISIPEIGTVKAERRPMIVLTANRTRSLSDALRRRCLYSWIPFPSVEQEVKILRTREPEAVEHLVEQVCVFVNLVRRKRYHKIPSVSESLDWLRALTLLGVEEIGAEHVDETLGVLFKDRDDLHRFAAQDHDEIYQDFAAGELS